MSPFTIVKSHIVNHTQLCSFFCSKSLHWPIGLHGQCLFIASDGLIHLTPVTQSLAQIIPGIGKLWIKFDRFTKCRDSVFMLALVIQSGAEVEMSASVRVQSLPNASKKPGSVLIAFW